MNPLAFPILCLGGLLFGCQERNTEVFPRTSGECGSEVEVITPGNPCLRYEGRIDSAESSRFRFDWPGTVIEARFQGTSVKARLVSMGAYFDVYVDGVKTVPATGGLGAGSLFVKADAEVYLLAKGLAPGEHSVRLEKRSESFYGGVEFRGFLVDAGQGIRPLPPRPDRRIEFIGDSYTVGFGNESPSKANPLVQDSTGRVCSDEELLAFTNSQATYAVLAAKAVGAEYQVNAFSGLGMVRHYQGSTAYASFQTYYQRTLMTDSASPIYQPSWIPHLVVIGLGGNDFSTPLGPNDAGHFSHRQALHQAYQDAYREFLKSLRDRYPGVKFILTASNMWPEDELKDQVKKVIASEKAQGRTDITYYEFPSVTGYGCMWHPDMATHQMGAQNLASLITQVTGWAPPAASIRH